MATIVNLSMSIGEDQPFTDTIVKADGVTPQDITNWALTFTIHAYGDPNIVYVTKTIGSGLTVPVPANGQVNIAMQNADTVNMYPGLYQWRIERTDTGNDRVLSTGLFTLNGK